MKKLCLLTLLLATLSTSNAQFSVNAGIGFNGLYDEQYRKNTGLGIVAGVEYEIIKRLSVIMDGEYYFPNSHEFETFVRAKSQAITPSFQDAIAKNTLAMSQVSVGLKYNILKGPQGTFRLFAISGIGIGYATYVYKIDDSTYDSTKYQPDVDDFDPSISGTKNTFSHPVLIFGPRVEKDVGEGLSLIFEANFSGLSEDRRFISPLFTPIVSPYPNAIRLAVKVKKVIDFRKKEAE